jgi:hypothetical protein
MNKHELLQHIDASNNKVQLFKRGISSVKDVDYFCLKLPISLITMLFEIILFVYEPIL